MSTQHHATAADPRADNASAGNRVNSHIGAQIRRRRLSLQRDMTKLALTTGMSTGQLAAIEAGEIRPKAAELYTLAQELGVSISYFFEDINREE